VKRRDYIKYTVGASALVAASLTGYSYFIETNQFQVTKLDLDMGIGRRLVHISDTHLGSSVYSVETLINIIKGLNPDIIIHTGDHITNTESIDSAIQFLEKLSLISEVYTVWGNHDLWNGFGNIKYRERVNGIDGATILVNESIYLDGFWLCGVNDPYTLHDDIEKTLGETGVEPRILLAHSPQIIDKARDRVELVLAGHTHGGQIRIPLLGPLWLPLPSKYHKYSQGLFREDNTTMYFTRGVGTVIFPFRFNCPPEVVLINI